MSSITYYSTSVCRQYFSKSLRSRCRRSCNRQSLSVCPSVCQQITQNTVDRLSRNSVKNQGFSTRNNLLYLWAIVIRDSGIVDCQSLGVATDRLLGSVRWQHVSSPDIVASRPQIDTRTRTCLVMTCSHRSGRNRDLDLDECQLSHGRAASTD